MKVDDSHVKNTAAVYDRIALSYAKKNEAYALIPEQNKWLKLLPQRSLILDVACASGRDSEFFLKHGLEVIGIDLSPKLLAIAKKRLPRVKFLLQDIRKLKFPNQYFDGIWANAILHHLKRSEIPKVIKQFYRLLKPQGWLFVAVHEGRGEREVTDQLSPVFPRHYTYLNQQELRTWLETPGFELLDLSVWNEKDRHPQHRDLSVLTCFARKP